MRFQKAEWIENNIKAREKAMVKRNIIAGRRGAGLWPIDCHRILEQISEGEITPQPQSVVRYAAVVRYRRNGRNGRIKEAMEA